jgi:hypothetical protein
VVVLSILDSITSSAIMRNRRVDGARRPTGQRGKIGSGVAGQRADHGVEPVGLDVAGDLDVRDLGTTRRLAAGCDAVLYLAAIAQQRLGTPAQICVASVEGVPIYAASHAYSNWSIQRSV